MVAGFLRRGIRLSVLILLLLFMGFGLAQDDSGADASTVQVSTLDQIEESGTLRVGVNPLFKPFSFEEGGERVGVDIDIARSLAEGLGVELELVIPEEFGDLIPMLLDGGIDVIMAGMSITFERAKQVDFSAPYFETGLSILLNKGKGGELGIGTVGSYDDLRAVLDQRSNEANLTIAVTEGKAPAEAVPRFFPEAQVVTYPTNEEAATAVLANEAHIMVHDEIFLKVWLRENGQNARFSAVVLDDPFKPDAYGFAVRKGDQDFLNLLNIFVRELHSEGYFAEYMGQYLELKAKTVTRSYDIVDDIYGGD